MDAFSRFKEAVDAAVVHLDFVAEYRRLTAGTGRAGAERQAPAAVPNRCVPLDAEPPNVLRPDWRRLFHDVAATLTPHGAPAAPAVMLAERLAGDMLAAVDAVDDDATGDTWRRLRAGIVERLAELERAVAELDAPRRAALDALRASRLPAPLAPPPPSPAKPSPTPARPAAPFEPPAVTPAAAADSKLETAADERLAGIVRRLSGNACRVASYLRAEEATSYRNPRNRETIAEALSLSGDDVNAVRNELAAAGVPVESKGGRNGGWWLTPDGVRVAEIVANEPSPTTAAKAGNGAKPGVNRG